MPVDIWGSSSRKERQVHSGRRSWDIRKARESPGEEQIGDDPHTSPVLLRCWETPVAVTCRWWPE